MIERSFDDVLNELTELRKDPIFKRAAELEAELESICKERAVMRAQNYHELRKLPATAKSLFTQQKKDALVVLDFYGIKTVEDVLDGGLDELISMLSHKPRSEHFPLRYWCSFVERYIFEVLILLEDNGFSLSSGPNPLLPENSDIEKLPVNTRIKKTLRENGINTISDLLQYSQSELKEMPGIGNDTIVLLYVATYKNGYKIP